jgi:predicted nucleotidyltransferase component of viral defense system
MLQKATVDQKLLNLIIRLQKDQALNNFILAGGTALALYLGHRKSIDIDLFTGTEFDEVALLEYLEREFDFRMNFQAKSTLKGSIEDIRVDLIAHQYPYLKDPAEFDGVTMASIEDISAMKVNAISGDGTRLKDFIDLYFLLNKFSFREIIGFFSTKYSSRNNAHAIKSLTWFEDVDLNDWPIMIQEPKLTFEKIKKEITRHRNMFLTAEGIV